MDGGMDNPMSESMGGMGGSMGMSRGGIRGGGRGGRGGGDRSMGNRSQDVSSHRMFLYQQNIIKNHQLCINFYNFVSGFRSDRKVSLLDQLLFI